MWGYAMAHGDRSVDVFVRKLRQKLRAASPHWSYIHTHFGVGYRFAPERDGRDVERELDLTTQRPTTRTPKRDELDAASPSKHPRARARARLGRPCGSQLLHIFVTSR